MAPSPLFAALAAPRHQLCAVPLNVVFLGDSGMDIAAVASALTVKKFACENAKNDITIQERNVGSVGPTKIFFTLVSLPTSRCGPHQDPAKPSLSLDPLRRHLLHGRPASVIVYVRRPTTPAPCESALIASLDAALGLTMWQNAACVTVTSQGASPSDSSPWCAIDDGTPAVPPALVRPGFQPSACLWDSTPGATSHVAGVIAEVAANTLPFLPEPQGSMVVTSSADKSNAGAPDPAGVAAAASAMFGELDLLATHNMSLASATETNLPVAEEPMQVLQRATDSPSLVEPTPEMQTPSCALDTSELSFTSQHSSSQQLMVQPSLVPAFASLSLAFAPSALLAPSVPALKPQRQGSFGAPPAAAAFRGMPSVKASLPLGSCASSVGTSIGATALSLPGAAGPRASVGARAPRTAFPEALRLRQIGPTFRSPFSAAAARRVVMVWFRNDLRVHDNEALAMANEEGSSVLPVYCFDPRDYGKSSSGFDRTGPFRARFLLQCVADLRRSLRERGSDLVVRLGHPERELASLARAVGASAVYAHQEVTRDDSSLETQVAAKLKDEGIETKFFWGSTLYHLDDLPFTLEDMPCNYGGFREAVRALKVRPTVEVSQRLKQLPATGNVNPGEIPTLSRLGLNSPGDMPTAGLRGPALTGGEGEALRRLAGFFKEAIGMQPLPSPQVQSVVKTSSPSDGTSQRESSTIGPCMLGASFSCKISPWLAMGCLSPRRMFQEMEKALPKAPAQATSGAFAQASSPGSSSSAELPISLDWLVFELLWRDFFRFITKKHSSVKRENIAAPVPA